MRDATVVHGHVEKELMEEVLLFGYRCLVIDAVTPPPPGSALPLLAPSHHNLRPPLS